MQDANIDEDCTEILYSFCDFSVSLKLFKNGKFKIIAFYPGVFGKKEFWSPVQCLLKIFSC